MKYKISDAAKLCGVHKQTMWKYVKDGKVSAIRTKNNRFLITQEEVDRYLGEVRNIEELGVAVYARVSSSENKDDLERQAERCVKFANAKGWRVVRIEKEIGSGVNDQRPKLLSLLRDAHKYDNIVVEHKDRLTRFGFNIIITLINNVYVINEVDSQEAGLMEDLVSIITSFCARLYGHRRSKRKTEKLIAELSEETD